MNNHIEKRIELKAPISRVWRALTDHREFGAWFQVNIDGPFIVGEVSRGTMTYPGCEHLEWEAVVQKMEPERLFSFTWPHCDLETGEKLSEDAVTLVEFKLKEIPGGTLLTITESGFDKIPANRRSEAFRLNEGGWSEQIRNIENYVSSKP